VVTSERHHLNCNWQECDRDQLGRVNELAQAGFGDCDSSIVDAAPSGRFNVEEARRYLMAWLRRWASKCHT